MCYWYWWY